MVECSIFQYILLLSVEVNGLAGRYRMKMEFWRLRIETGLSPCLNTTLGGARAPEDWNPCSLGQTKRRGGEDEKKKKKKKKKNARST